MNKTIKLLLLFAVFLLATSVAQSQRRNTKATVTRSSASSLHIFCKGETIPKGFVVVGYKSSSAKCSANSELVIKKPADSEIVCDGSPIPEGYHVVSQEASMICATADSNPLTNALSIARNGSGASSQTVAARTNNDESAFRTTRTTTVTVRVGGGNQDDGEQKPKSFLEQRAADEQKKTEIELAVLHHQIKVGMTTDQVLASWGRPNDADNVTSSGSGTSSTWTYRRDNGFVHLHFDN